MNRLLLALLAVSLGLNAWLAFSSIRVTPANSPVAASDRLTKPAAAKEISASADAAKDSAAVAAARPFIWKNPGNSPEALRELAANLRAAGVPPAIVGRMIGETLRAQLFADIARLPYWQLLSPGKETRRRQSDAARELLRLQEEIVGPSGAAVKTLDPTQRRLDYGDLPDDKVTALLRIQRDYDDLRNDLFMGGGSVITREESDARRKEQENLEKERLADIVAALTPEEYAEYERRQSPAAQRIQRSLRELNLTEDAYLALLALEKARDPYNNNFVGSIGTVTPEKAAFMDQVRTTLGDAQANTYLKSSDFSYGMVARFAEKYPTITPVQTFELYKLQSEAQAWQSDLSKRASSGGGVTLEEATKAGADLNARLEALIGSAAADAYRKQGLGFAFGNFPRSRPTPAATPPKG